MERKPPKPKVCDNPDCKVGFIPTKLGQKHCSAECFYKCKAPVIPKPVKNIKRRSDKRAEEEKVYLQVAKMFLAKPENKICPVTGDPATEVHHKKGRIGKLLLDVRFFLAVSRKGHRWIEEHPIEAKEKGWSLSRLENG